MAINSSLKGLDLWGDDRSGAAGRYCGNIVLSRLSGGDLRKLKGSALAFANEDTVFLGRAVGTDSYLNGSVLHWANLSHNQHDRFAREAMTTGRELRYLFVTGSLEQAGIHVWNVPSDVVQRHFERRSAGRDGTSVPLHIVQSGAKHLLGPDDVQAFHSFIALAEKDLERLRDALKNAQEETADEIISPASAPNRREAPGRQSASRPLRVFSIPLSRGRVAELRIADAIGEPDVARIKGWMDLMSDVLTERAAPARSEPWFQSAVQDGLDELDRDDTVDGEAAFERILDPRNPRRVRG